MKQPLHYYRKITCPSLKIAVVLSDQAYALRLFSLLKDKGYHDSVLLDFFVEKTANVKLSDKHIEKLLAKVK